MLQNPCFENELKTHCLSILSIQFDGFDFNLEEEYETLKSKTNLDLWKEDLDEFIIEYKKMEKARNTILQKDIKKFKS